MTLMLPLLEVEDIPGTTSWRVTLRDGDDLKVGNTRYFDGPNAEQEANEFVNQLLNVVLQANESALKL